MTACTSACHRVRNCTSSPAASNGSNRDRSSMSSDRAPAPPCSMPHGQAWCMARKKHSTWILGYRSHVGASQISEAVCLLTRRHPSAGWKMLTTLSMQLSFPTCRAIVLECVLWHLKRTDMNCTAPQTGSAHRKRGTSPRDCLLAAILLSTSTQSRSRLKSSAGL